MSVSRQVIVHVDQLDSHIGFREETTQPQEVLLLGYPVSHSLSPLLHNTVFRNLGLPGWSYKTFESQSLPPCIDMLRRPDLVGCGVTMPFKVAIVPLLDAVTPRCQSIGSCNTIITRGGTGKLSGKKIFIGDNTDCIGIRESIRRTMAVKGLKLLSARQPALIIGAGGTTRAAVYALHTWLNAGPIYIINRLENETQAIVDQFSSQGIHVTGLCADTNPKDVPQPFLIVGCIPHIPPATEAEKSVRRFSNAVLASTQHPGVVLDMCYKPRRTFLLQEAAKNSWTTVEGIEAMLEQGLEQDVLWTGLPRHDMKEAEVGDLIRAAEERKTTHAKI